MRKLVGLLMLLAAGSSKAQTQEMTAALDGFRQGGAGRTTLAMTGATAALGMGMGMGNCNYQDLPYMGMSSGGTSPSWQVNYSQMHSMMCYSTTGMYAGMYVDTWKVPAQPGDVFDITFAGPFNCLLAVADFVADPTPYVQMRATMPGTGSQAGKYVGGWMSFTVPTSFTHGYMTIWVGNTMGQMQYMMGVVKTSSQPLTSCTPSATAMCLDGGRFQVTADWQTPNGEAGHGNAIPMTPDTGYFWFFNATNVELVVKVLDACTAFGHHWVFAGGLTNVAVTLTVTDTQTGAVKTYLNPQSTAFVPLQDTAAFTCP